jgi:hypothetical protein
LVAAFFVHKFIYFNLKKALMRKETSYVWTKCCWYFMSVKWNDDGDDVEFFEYLKVRICIRDDAFKFQQSSKSVWKGLFWSKIIREKEKLKFSVLGKSNLKRSRQCFLSSFCLVFLLLCGLLVFLSYFSSFIHYCFLSCSYVITSFCHVALQYVFLSYSLFVFSHFCLSFDLTTFLQLKFN